MLTYSLYTLIQLGKNTTFRVCLLVLCYTRELTVKRQVYGQTSGHNIFIICISSCCHKNYWRTDTSRLIVYFSNCIYTADYQLFSWQQLSITDIIKLYHRACISRILYANSERHYPRLIPFKTIHTCTFLFLINWEYFWIWMTG